MHDDLELAEALGRALELAPHEPSPERIAALQRQVRRQRLRRPLRRAAVAAAVALIALTGAALAVGTARQHDSSSADAVAVSKTLRAIEQVQSAILTGNRVQIRQSTDVLKSQLDRLDPAEKAAVGADAKAVLAKAQSALGPAPSRASPSPSTVPTTSSSMASTTTTSASTTTSTSSSTTTTTSTPTTIPTPSTTISGP